MADAFLSLPEADRKEALATAAAKLNRPAHLLEKDVWVVWALRTIFASPLGSHLTFKGGTSLSKAYQVINRFSEDIDLTLDIRWIANDLVGEGDPIPQTAPLARKWSDDIKARLERIVAQDVADALRAALKQDGLSERVRTKGEKAFLDYAPLHRGTGYVEPIIVLEFGARATGEPNEERHVLCDAAPALPMLVFPKAKPRVMRPERTFWEKATAIHVFCIKGRFRGGKGFARHWYDLVALDSAQFADAALADAALAQAVARHKSVFFIEKDATGAEVDYASAVSGALQLVPTGTAAEELAKDYNDMIQDGLLAEDAPPLEEILRRCSEIARKANASAG